MRRAIEQLVRSGARRVPAFLRASADRGLAIAGWIAL